MYDEDEDLIHFFSGNAVKDSIEAAKGIVLDISHNEKVVGLEIRNATSVLSKYCGIKITKSSLSSVKEAYLRSVDMNNMVFVILEFLLQIDSEQIKKEFSLNMPGKILARV